MEGQYRIFVECTHTFFVGGSGGIRRVARSIANCSLGGFVIEGVEIIPIVWGGMGFFKIKKKLSERPHFLQRLRSGYRYIQFLVGKAYQFTPPIARRPFTFLKKIIGASLEGAVSPEMVYFLIAAISFPLRFMLGRSVHFKPGDTVILVDSTWNSAMMLDYLFKSRLSSEIKIGVMIHDLFPLTMPEVCEEQTIAVFNRWFKQVSPLADFFVTNSNNTTDILLSYIKEKKLIHCTTKIGNFKLGAELSGLTHRRKSSRNAELIWSLTGIVLLAVGTIEPRKNYGVLIDAFDMIVERYSSVTLLIIGQAGWKSEHVMDRIKDHELFGTRLIHICDASDFDLEQAYERANCLVCCSIAEGFGLPLVEGLKRGLPAIVSDIPPFKEIGSAAAGFRYVDASSPQALADSITEFLSSYERGITSYPRIDWPNWEESTRLMAETVLNLSGHDTKSSSSSG